MTTALLLCLFAFIGYLGGTITEALHFKSQQRQQIPSVENELALSESIVSANYIRRAWLGLQLIAGRKVTAEKQWIMTAKRRLIKKDHKANFKGFNRDIDTEMLLNNSGEVCGVIATHRPSQPAHQPNA